MENILIPLDGSPLAEQALEMGRAVAEQSGATIRLVHVRNRYHPIFMEGLPVIDEHLQPVQDLHEQSYLEGVQARLQAAGVVDVEVDLLDGSAAPTLASHAVATGSDLIIMTSHGYGGFERFWLGSVAESLLRISEVPLLLQCPQGDAPAGAEPFTCDAILLPLDGSALAEGILAPVEQLAKLMGARVHLLRVLSPQEAAAPPLDTGITAEHYLQKVAAMLRWKGVVVETELRTHEQPAHAILSVAEEQGVELIAMATHGRGGLQRLLLGSVSNKVLRGSSRPLLLYRPREVDPPTS